MSYDEVKWLLQMINIDLSEQYARCLFKVRVFAQRRERFMSLLRWLAGCCVPRLSIRAESQDFLMCFYTAGLREELQHSLIEAYLDMFRYFLGCV